MDSHEYAGGYIASTMKAIKSWLRFNLGSGRNGLNYNSGKYLPDEDHNRIFNLSNDFEAISIPFGLRDFKLRQELLISLFAHSPSPCLAIVSINHCGRISRRRWDESIPSCSSVAAWPSRKCKNCDDSDLNRPSRIPG